MMSFYEDIDYSRSTPARITSYSVSLFDAGKSSCMTYYILSLVRALSCKLILAPV